MTTYFTNYYKAKKYAEEQGLVENVYGDWNEDVSYCGWNKTGDINGECEVEAYYHFDGRYPEQETSDWLADWVKYNIGVETIND